MSSALDRLTGVYMDRTGELRERLLEQVLGLWDSLPDYWTITADEFVEAVLPLVEGGLLQVEALTEWYVDSSAQHLGIKNAARLQRRPYKTRAERDADALLRRPLSTVYGELAQGAPLAVAVQRGRDRLGNIVSTEVTDMARKSAHSRMRLLDGKVAYRRVLTGRENCALCAIASTRLYWKSELMPIHPGCDCGVALVPKGTPLDRPLDGDLLEQVHELVERDIGQVDRAGELIKIDGEDASYRDLIVTYEHSELGPTLAYRKHHHKKS